MFRTFHDTTADGVWRQVADAFCDTDSAQPQSSRAGGTREILRAAICVDNPRERWVLSRNLPINPAFALAEVVWIVAGRNDANFLKYFNRRLPDFAGLDPQFHGAYGYRLRTHHNVDQLDRAYRALSSNPDSRQVVLQIWDVRSDFPSANGDPVAADIPCNISSMVKVRNNRLEWTQIVRSNDAYLGLPYNFVQFTTLQEIIAGWLGVEVGTYAQLSDSLHVYDDSLDRIRATEPVEFVENTDRLTLTRKETDSQFARLASLVGEVISESLSPTELRPMVLGVDLAEPLRNMLCVLVAESARRRQEFDTMWLVLEDCTNQLYQVLFERWFQRVSPQASRALV